MAKATLAIALLLVSCYFVVLASGQLTYPPDADALNAIRRKLKDPLKNLRGWRKGDPCVANWTGVICTLDLDDGYRHVQELRMLNLNLTGELAPELGQLSYMLVLNFMWNGISGSIPKEIGNLKALQFLLLSGNQLSGPLPEELGYMPSLKMLQADMNQISGTLPISLRNLTNCRHFHLNNNSISGQIPPELSVMPQLIHFLLDNNNLSGFLPPEFSKMPNLRILQVDNNDFGGTEIPASYGNIPTLVKVSLRRCNLTGAVPDFSNITRFRYLDLGHNRLTGGIPTNKLSDSVTTIDLSYNMLNGSIPSNFSGLPILQRLSLNNNSLTGDVPSTVWQNQNVALAPNLIIDFRNNLLSNISGSINPPSNVTMRLDGNPVCNSANQLNIAPFCGLENEDNDFVPGGSSDSNNICRSQSCPLTDGYEYVPDAPDGHCFCAVPFRVTLRLRSPTITDFRPYTVPYKMYMTSSLGLALYQLDNSKFVWEAVHRLRLNLTFYPQYSNDTHKFNYSEVDRIISSIATFVPPSNDTFGPYEIIGFALGPYSNASILSSKSGMSKGALAGIILGAMSFIVALSLVIIVLFYKRRTPSQHQLPKKKSTRVPIRTESVKEFLFEELEAATSCFSDTTQVGQGGYGKVYRGILANGTEVAIKRARQGSLQGQLEFITEIELLSRLHHRNLVSLVGYCSEKGEQMLVYEFMPNGSLHDLLSDRCRHTLSFPLRLRIALGAAKGILYLHTEADPPIIHRDIKANNILLDFKFTPKVSDFGISRLAPVPDDEGASAHVSTVVKGTPGYLDPEYFLTHKLTEKSDVYSLGIVFLELLTGMLPISHGKNIVREVHGACEAGLMLSIVDRSMGSHPSECIKKFMALALKCCQDDPKERPTMLEVVRELENLSAIIPDSDHSNPLDSDASNSNSGSRPLYSHYGRDSQPTTEIFGSELVSGVIPTIRPR